MVGLLLMVVDDRLDRVAQELADNVLEVAEDVGKAGLEVAVDFHLGHLHLGAVGGAGELGDGFCTAADDILGDALDEDFAYEVGLGEGGAGREVGGVEGFCKGEVLLRNDPSRDALRGSQ